MMPNRPHNAPPYPWSPLFREHEEVRLKHAIADQRLAAGDKGVIVHIYENRMGYEVEFMDRAGLRKVVTLEGSDLEPI